MALQWDDLDFDTGVVAVNKQVHEVKGQLRLSVRKLVLPPGVVVVLQEYRIYNSVSLFLR